MKQHFHMEEHQLRRPIYGRDRQLLSNVSGYVAPSKLTALSLRLAIRTDTGVATGDPFVNGQSLPADFQSRSYVMLFISEWLMLSEE